jgi:hypothetical protein
MPSRSFGDRKPRRPHLLRSGGLAREIDDLRSDVEEGFTSLEAEALPLTEVVSVFVASSGDDTTGDGTQGRPYATVARALRDRKAFAAPSVAFRVQVVAPYTGPGFIYEDLVQSAESTQTTPDRPPTISVESFYDAAQAGTADPRFITEVGPITASAASILNTAWVSYTVPTGSFTSSHIGKIIRVFRGGVEVGRGTLAHIVTGATDVVYIAQSRTSGPVASWAPASGDALYACDHSIVFTSPIRINVGRRVNVLLAGFKISYTGGATTLLSPLSIYGGWVHAVNLRILSTDTYFAFDLLEGAYAFSQYIPSTIAQWMDPTERTFLFMAGGFISHAGGATTPSSNISGACHLRGYVFDKRTLVHGRGTVVSAGMWFRGQLSLANGGRLDPSAPVVFGGNRATPIAQPPLWTDGGLVGNNTATAVAVMVDTAGYAAGQSMCTVRRSTFTSRLTFNGIDGAAVITQPVVNAEMFSSAMVAAGNITGPLNNDVRAGTTSAAFAGLPIVDAATLTRIATG